METTLFKNPKVLTALENFVILKIDVTRNNADDKALLKKYHVVAPPTFVFFNQRGEWLDKLQLVGEVNSNNFLKHLQLIVAQK